MGFIFLPSGKLHKKIKKRRLKTFPVNYVEKCYRNLAERSILTS